MLKINTSVPQSFWRVAVALLLSVVTIGGVAFTYKPQPAQAFASNQESYTAGDGKPQDMNVVRADGENRPAIIFVHGGGWRVDGGTFGPDFQNRAAERGYTSFRISYRLMANGINEQLKDVESSIKHVRDNAAKYGIDPNRIAIWGDSAGGSLVVRAAATGKSGAAVAVGWSAPTNGFRDIFNSWQGFVDGLDHTECVDTSFTDILGDFIPLFQGQQGVLDKIMRGELPTPDEAIALATATLQGANIAIDQLPSTFDKLQKSANEWGIEIKVDKGGNSSPGTTTPPTTDTPQTPGTPKPDGSKPPISREELKDTLQTMTPEERAEVGKAAYYMAKTSQNTELTPEQKEVVAAVQLGMSDVISAQASNVQEDSAKEGGQQSGSGPNVSVEVNPQGEMLTKKIIECLEDFIKMSPSLFASPRTPPMFLANAQSEYLVNPADARQMSDKLRSMGIRSEYLILPGDRHMGYDERAEGPSFDFVSSILHP